MTKCNIKLRISCMVNELKHYSSETSIICIKCRVHKPNDAIASEFRAKLSLYKPATSQGSVQLRCYRYILYYHSEYENK